MFNSMYWHKWDGKKQKATSCLFLADCGSKQIEQEQALHPADPSQHPYHLHLRSSSLERLENHF